MADNFSVKELAEALECPICCLTPQSTPIYQCENGHMICKVCHDRLTICPSCCQPLGKIRNILAEQLLEKVTKPCRFAIHGCSAKVQLNLQDSHAANCKFREVKCPAWWCQTISTPICKMETHLVEKHEYCEIPLTSSPVEFEIILIDRDFERSGDYASYNKSYMKCKDCLLFLKHHRDHEQKLFFVWMSIAGTKEQARNFLFKISLLNEVENEKLTFESRPISIDVPCEEIIKSNQGLIFSDGTARRCLYKFGAGKYLKFKLKVITPK
jgi:hypothetical protein